MVILVEFSSRENVEFSVIPSSQKYLSDLVAKVSLSVAANYWAVVHHSTFFFACAINAHCYRDEVLESCVRLFRVLHVYSR